MPLKEQKRLTTGEMRSIQLDILLYFIDFCKKNSIKYYLAYGSLLGAVRHKGYIPWDDDIDVMIFREDVEKLLLNFGNERFSIINSSTNDKYFSPLIKAYDKKTLLVQGYGQVEGINICVNIDVFVLDRVPADENERRDFYDKAANYRFKWSLSCSSIRSKSKNFIVWLVKRVISLPFKIIGYRFFSKKYDSFASSYQGKSLYAIVVYGEGFEKEYTYTEDDLESIEATFEGITISIPKSYDLVLKKCYGDYMSLPPVEARKRHPVKAYAI